MPLEEVSPAVVLRTRDYSEADRIVTLLTHDCGKLSGIAKGAKHSRRRFERKLEVFSHVMVYFRRRPQGELVFITRAEAAHLPPFDLTDDLGKIGLASYMVELADALSREAAESSGAYRILTAALANLARHGAGNALRQAFELHFLRWAGYQLEFARCRLCEALPGSNVSSFAFVPAYGGIVCHLCRARIESPALSLSAASTAALAQLGAASFEAVATMPGGGNDAQVALSRFMATVLDRRLRSLDFLDSVLQLRP